MRLSSLSRLVLLDLSAEIEIRSAGKMTREAEGGG